MHTIPSCFFILVVSVVAGKVSDMLPPDNKVEIIDMTKATNINDLRDFYRSLEIQASKMCVNCGFPWLGTAMHMDIGSRKNAISPAVIPSEYLLTRLIVIDLSEVAKKKNRYVLNLKAGLNWSALRKDPEEPTLLFFRFGYTDNRKRSNCVCPVPGISFELAEWISANLTHVVGIATDAPTLESDETREFATRTVAFHLGRNGIYMIDNVSLNRKIPERGCMAIAMPMKILNTYYVPTRLTAYCPAVFTDQYAFITLQTMNKGRREI